ncbi:NUDIX hydrolase [Kineococcus esterisolvens]|uniref:NUDIX hydrolase n=1 Tax=unclassified Kineococcus TaxID=2621656 RepID=UPI003D7E5C03
MRVVAAAVVVDGHLLTVSKQAAPDVFYLPGGKPDGDEPEIDTLLRELTEELQVQPVGAEPYLVVEAPAALEAVPMRMSVYRCDLSAPPQRAAEIAAVHWCTGEEPAGGRLAPAVRDAVVPRLREDGLLVGATTSAVP